MVEEDFPASFGFGDKDIVLQQLSFQRAMAAFHGGVVIAVACRGHPRCDVPACQQRPVGTAGIWQPRSAMVQEPREMGGELSGLASGLLSPKIVASPPTGKAIHVIADNLSALKAKLVE